MIDTEVSFSSLYNTFSDSGLEDANRTFTEEAFKDMQRYVPMEFGDLRGSGRVIGHDTIEWGAMVYAPVQYYTQFVNYTTPGTGPHWDKVASGNHMSSWERMYVRGLGL